MSSIWLIGVAFILIIIAIVWGVFYTRKHTLEDRLIKYRAAAFLFTVGFILSVGYLFAAKKFAHHIDLTLAWMFLATGLIFASAVSAIVGFLTEPKQ